MKVDYHETNLLFSFLFLSLLCLGLIIVDTWAWAWSRTIPSSILNQIQAFLHKWNLSVMSMTAQLLASELSSLVQESRRKNQEIRAVCFWRQHDWSLPGWLQLGCREIFEWPQISSANVRSSAISRFRSEVCMKMNGFALTLEEIYDVDRTLRDHFSLLAALGIRNMQAAASSVCSDSLFPRLYRTSF